MSEISEKAFRLAFGERPVTIHIQTRGIEHDGEDYISTPEMWTFVERFPSNIWVFCTVDPQTEAVCFDGWGTGAEIKEKAFRRGRGYQIPSTRNFPHIDKFCKRVERQLSLF